MKLNLTEKDTCPRCGAKFDCGKSGKCWCYEVDVPTQIQEAINSKYSTCLCRNCLQLLAANPKLEKL